jgi:hypothetical protein
MSRPPTLGVCTLGGAAASALGAGALSALIMVAVPAQAATIEISTSTGPAGSALSPGKTTGATAISELISEPSTWAIVALGFVAARLRWGL